MSLVNLSPALRNKNLTEGEQQAAVQGHPVKSINPRQPQKIRQMGTGPGVAAVLLMQSSPPPPKCQPHAHRQEVVRNPPGAWSSWKH